MQLLLPGRQRLHPKTRSRARSSRHCPWPRSGNGADEQRHVVHLPIAVAEPDAALRFAYTLARSLALVPGIDVAGATVSVEDDQHVRRWVFCDRIMPDRRRCTGRADHAGPCAAETETRTAETETRTAETETLTADGG
ncbi:hypothetical protein [Micromonospora sp. NPDC049282]|uniref:hypothetical protein n=1 Tax=Micromonospora sp. NPDC049282 TaxID=3364269 RepID=UPI00371B85BE